MYLQLSNTRLIDIVNILINIDDYLSEMINQLSSQRENHSKALLELNYPESTWDKYYDALGAALGMKNLYHQINRRIIDVYSEWKDPEDVIDWFSMMIETYNLPDFHRKKYGEVSFITFIKKTKEILKYLKERTHDQRNSDGLHIISFKDKVVILTY